MQGKENIEKKRKKERKKGRKRERERPTGERVEIVVIQIGEDVVIFFIVERVAHPAATDVGHSLPLGAQGERDDAGTSLEKPAELRTG